MEDEQKNQNLNRALLIGGASAVVGAGTVAAITTGTKNALLILTIVGVIVLLGLGLLFLYRFWHRRRQSQGFSGELTSVFRAAQRGQDPESLSRLKTLEDKFNKGIRKFRESGKDIYELPWYIIIGPSGSGKSCALREGRLPGMELIRPDDSNEPAVGEKGKIAATLCMDWWFGDDSVILDTAGGTVFPEEQAMESPEWRALLKMLKKQRPECPFNGLFVAIDAEKLKLDSAELQEYADKLRVQLEFLQKNLDLRFPVYFLITKSDVLPGFREFADEMSQGGNRKLDQQIIGWSRPLKDSLDKPFEPAMVGAYLGEVSESLRRRRLRMLRDLAGQACQFDGDARRDAMARVAALYTFPEEIERVVAPRLQSWFGEVFKSKTWSTRPVFVRGIYFTSALREGGVLDAAKAEVLGIPLAELQRRHQVATTRRSFFLSDAFTHKAFKERGLVMPLTEARKYVSNKKRLIFASTIGATMMWAVLVGFGWMQLKSSLGREIERWGVLRGENGVANASLFSKGGEFRGGDKVGTDHIVTSLHRELALATRTNLNLGFLGGLYRPFLFFGENFEENRRKAQVGVFERLVVQPLFKETRAAITAEAPTSADVEANSVAVRRNNAALLALARFELPITPKREVTALANESRELFQGLLLGSAGRTNELEDLVLAFAHTYAKREAPEWPLATLRKGDILNQNLALDAGLRRFASLSTRIQGSMAERLGQLTNTAAALTVFAENENDHLLQIADSASRTDIGEEIDKAKTDLEKLTAKLGQLQTLGFAGDNPFTPVLGGFTNLLRDNEKMRGQLRGDLIAGLTNLPGATTNRLLLAMTERLEKMPDSFGANLGKTFGGLFRGITNSERRAIGTVTWKEKPRIAAELRLEILEQALAKTNASITYDKVARSGWGKVEEDWSQTWKDFGENYPPGLRQEVSGDSFEKAWKNLTNQVAGEYLENSVVAVERNAAVQLDNIRADGVRFSDGRALVAKLDKLQELRTKWLPGSDAVGRDHDGAAKRALELHKEFAQSLDDRVATFQNALKSDFSNNVLADRDKFPFGTQGEQAGGLTAKQARALGETLTRWNQILSEKSQTEWEAKILSALNRLAPQGITADFRGVLEEVQRDVAPILDLSGDRPKFRRYAFQFAGKATDVSLFRYLSIRKADEGAGLADLGQDLSRLTTNQRFGAELGADDSLVMSVKYYGTDQKVKEAAFPPLANFKEPTLWTLRRMMRLGQRAEDGGWLIPLPVSGEINGRPSSATILLKAVPIEAR